MSNLSQFLATSVTTTLTANDTIQVGDVVALAADGYAYATTDPTLSGFTSRPIYAQDSLPKRLTAVGTLTSNVASTQPAYNGLQSITLANGSTVFFWTDTSWNCVFSIYDTSNALVAGPTTVAALIGASQTYQFAPVALTTGGFSVSYGTNVNTLRTVVYSNTGTVVTASAVIDSPGTVTPVVKGDALANGCYVLGYNSYASGNGTASFSVLVVNSTGSVVVGPSQYAPGGDTVNITGYNFDVVALPTTNAWAVAYVNAISAQVIKTVAYYSNGTARGTTTVFTGTAGNTYSLSMVALGNGNYAITTQSNNATVGLNGYTYDSAGTLQGSLTIDATAAYPSTNAYRNVVTAPTSNGSAWMVAWVPSDGANVKFATINSTGGQVGTTTATAFQARYHSLGGLATLDNSMLVSLISNTGNTYTVAKFYSNGVVAGSQTTPYALSGVNAIMSMAHISTYGQVNFAFVQNGSGILQSIDEGSITYRVPIGVAQSNATASQSVVVQVTGYANTRLQYNQTWNCDYTGVTPPGQKMFLVGSTAYMYGIK